MTTQNYFGIYGATVVSNMDPMQLGRISVSVPAVPAAANIWASPCLPFTGKQMGAFMIPKAGAHVWVQFEGGDKSKPVWMGGHYASSGEVPAPALAGVSGDPNIVLQSASQHAIVISDSPGPGGGILLKSTGGATIVVNDTGIYIQNGKGASVVLSGLAVTINDGALVVT